MFIGLYSLFQKKVSPIRGYRVLYNHINISKYLIYQLILILTQNFRVQDPIENDLMENLCFWPTKESIHKIYFCQRILHCCCFFFSRQEMILRGFFPTIQENHFLAININGFSNKLHT